MHYNNNSKCLLKFPLILFSAAILSACGGSNSTTPRPDSLPSEEKEVKLYEKEVNALNAHIEYYRSRFSGNMQYTNENFDFFTEKTFAWIAKDMVSATGEYRTIWGEDEDYFDLIVPTNGDGSYSSGLIYRYNHIDKEECLPFAETVESKLFNQFHYLGGALNSDDYSLKGADRCSISSSLDFFMVGDTTFSNNFAYLKMIKQSARLIADTQGVGSLNTAEVKKVVNEKYFDTSSELIFWPNNDPNVISHGFIRRTDIPELDSNGLPTVSRDFYNTTIDVYTVDGANLSLDLTDVGNSSCIDLSLLSISSGVFDQVTINGQEFTGLDSLSACKNDGFNEMTLVADLALDNVLDDRLKAEMGFMQLLMDHVSSTSYTDTSYIEVPVSEWLLDDPVHSYRVTDFYNGRTDILTTLGGRIQADSRILIFDEEEGYSLFYTGLNKLVCTTLVEILLEDGRYGNPLVHPTGALKSRYGIEISEPARAFDTCGFKSSVKIRF